MTRNQIRKVVAERPLGGEPSPMPPRHSGEAVPVSPVVGAPASATPRPWGYDPTPSRARGFENRRWYNDNPPYVHPRTARAIERMERERKEDR